MNRTQSAANARDHKSNTGLEVMAWLKANDLISKGEFFTRRAGLIEEYDDTTTFDLAKHISANFPVQAFFSDASLCLKRGSETYWLLPKELLKSTLRARDIVAQLGANDGKEPPFGIGSCARLLLKWLGAEQYTTDFADLITPAHGGQHYKLARPGEHKGTFHQYDLIGAYWQCVARMPSPYVYERHGRVIFANARPAIKARWEALKEAVSPCKPLRLAVVGRMLGGSQSRCFYKGELQRGRGIGEGFLAPAARLAIRTIYEACYLAAQSESSPYCNVDSVMTEARKVWAWDQLGLDYKREPSRGDVIVAGVGAYRIGDKVTDLFEGAPQAPFESTKPARFVSPWLQEEYAQVED